MIYINIAVPPCSSVGSSLGSSLLSVELSHKVFRQQPQFLHSDFNRISMCV